MSEQIDANLPAETSSAFASALAAHDDAPSKSESTPAHQESKEVKEEVNPYKGKVTKKEVTKSDNVPDSSAGTLNTVKSGQSTDANPENVPWDKDPRFKQFLTDKKTFQTEREKFELERKELSSKADQGDVWTKAFQQHPALAQKVIALINDFNSGSSGGSTETNSIPETKDELSIELEKVAEKMLTTPQFKALKKDLDDAKSTLSQTAKAEKEKEENDKKARGQSIASTYKSDLTKYLGESSTECEDEFRPTLETNIWNRLCQEDKQSVQDIKYSDKFKEIALEEIEKYKGFINKINSKYSKKALETTTPKTMKGGAVPTTPSQVDPKQELKDFANAIRSLPKS